jgi:hypothetical protein
MQADCGLGQPQLCCGLGEAEMLGGGREGAQPYEVWQSLHFLPKYICDTGRNGAVKLMRTRIRLMAQHKSMHSIIDATQREPRHGSA